MILSIAILAIALTGTAQARNAPPDAYSPGPASASLERVVAASGGRAADAEQVRYAYLRKLDSHLQELATADLRGRDLGAAADREGLTVTGGEDVVVDVYVDGNVEAAAEGLRDLGMRVTAVSQREPQRMVEGRLPAGALTDAAGLDRTRAVIAVLGQGVDIGSVTSEGDAAHRGPQARSLGADGTGVKVGVISDSINQVGTKIAGSQSSGDLPGPASSPPGSVTVLKDGAAGSSDEGRAMAEIIFDTAIGVRQMFFASGTLSGAADKADSINQLVAQGVKVIADDIFYIDEPFFQDGVISQAANAAQAANVTYLASAGNRARQSWEGTYTPTTDPRGVSASANDFDTGAPADAVQTVGTFTNRNLTLSLQWDEPWTQATTNLAIDVYTITAGVPTFIGAVDTDNIATGLPKEIFGLNIGATPTTVGIGIRRVAGARNPFMKYIVAGTQTFTIAEYPTNSDTINPDASSAAGALSIAAVAARDPGNDTPEGFSSRGPKTRLFDKNGVRLTSPEVRQKPDVAGADVVSTTVPGFMPFGGTSAATPSIAGIVALLYSANPTLTQSEVAAILRDVSHTLECTEDAMVRPDFDCGFGFELADGGVSQALGPVVTAVVSPPTPNGANGFYTSDVAVSFTVAANGSPVSQTTGCAPTTVNADGTVTLTCAATNARATRTVPVTIKRDATPPSIPVIAGIAAQEYTAATLPPQSAITCTANDPTSAVTSCTISGYDASPGAHTLTATATNGAGLTRTSTLTYSVSGGATPSPTPAVTPAPTPTVASTPTPTPTPRPAISRLKRFRTQLRARVVRSGLLVRLTANPLRTKLKIRVKLGKRTVAAKTKAVGNGAVRVRVKLSAAGRRRLRTGGGRLKVTVTGSALGFRTTTLSRSVKLKR